MKENAGDFRESAVSDIIKLLKTNNIKVILYESSLKESVFSEYEVINDLNLFF